MVLIAGRWSWLAVGLVLIVVGRVLIAVGLGCRGSGSLWVAVGLGCRGSGSDRRGSPWVWVAVAGLRVWVLFFVISGFRGLGVLRDWLDSSFFFLHCPFCFPSLSCLDLGVFDVFQVLVDWLGLDFHFDIRLMYGSEAEALLEQSRNTSFHASYGSPENLKTQTTNLAIASEGCSPKISEWRNKGVEGMFEDIHEMDTACIDDSYPPMNLNGHLGVKLGNHGASWEHDISIIH
ncbi:hypothetical protein SO802_030179 [Lithocarpus litseifolius]|uniref:Uncharacterized protein n=1 Tax=Lithocarpus litseifolius TaxID=425828 RepID=A0AAW2C0U0_9ROSI